MIQRTARSGRSCHTALMTIAASPVAATVARRDPRELMTRLQSRFGASMLAANFDGAAIVFIFLGFLLPRHQRYAVAR